METLLKCANSLFLFLLEFIERQRYVGACQKWIYHFHLTFELPAQRGAPGRIGAGPEREEEVVEESVLLAPHV